MNKLTSDDVMNAIKKVTWNTFVISILVVTGWSLFKAGELNQELKTDSVNLSRVCNYCTGERWAQKLSIYGDELRVHCGKGDDERIGVLRR